MYAFVSPDKAGTVTLMANWIPFEEPNGGPNFYPFATRSRYNIKIDNDGDAKTDITYRWTFRNEDRRGTTTFLYNNGPVTSLDDPNLLFRQRYTLKRITQGGTRTLVSDGVVAPPATSAAPRCPTTAPCATRPSRPCRAAARASPGSRTRRSSSTCACSTSCTGGNLSLVGQDTLKGYNVNTVAVQIPAAEVALKGDPKRNPVIGVCSTTDKYNGSSYVQVSRLCNPLVNELVASAGLKEAYNALDPSKDAGVKALVDRVTDPEAARLLQAVYGIKAPATPRADLVEIFLTGIAKQNGPIKADLNSQVLNKDAGKLRPAEMLRLNMSIPPAKDPNRLGVLGGDLQGFPNGRRLTDDVVDISLQAVAGAAQTGKLVAGLTDKVDANDKPTLPAFPYIPLPSNVAVNQR
ncbi:DUF4331 domain-containing protein [Nonomuraea salmonea]|uniref:DUF4331 domain-containing protein n=1 Tax=Nonomuraea salmonea TaxID=46181 RepID=UPI002FE7D357